jgi:transmembrane sensor
MSPRISDVIHDEAKAWYWGRRNRTPTAGEEAAFAVWFERAPEHRQAYQQLERIFSLLGGAAQRGELLHDQIERAVVRRRQRRVVLALAASLLAVVSVGAVMLALSGDYRTAPGDSRSIALDDGSRVHLSGATKLSVRFTKAERLVELRDGEALFEVAKDPSRPFRVDAGTQIVQAVGTAFDVSRISGNVEVAVGEGVVSVTPAATSEPASKTPPAATQLHAGQAITFDGRVSRTGIRAIDATRVGAWRQGSLLFDGVTFARMLDSLGRHYGGKFVVEDQTLARRVVTLPVNPQSRADLIKLIEDVMSVRGNQRGDTVTFVSVKSR